MLTRSYWIKVQFGDCDPAGIVFYPNYFRWFDQCFNTLLEDAGIPGMLLLKEHGVMGMPLLEAGSKFLRSSTVRDVLDITTAITEINAKTVRVSHTVRSGDEVRLEGWEVRIWAGAHPDDPQRLQAWPIPPGIRTLFEGRRDAQ